VRRVSVLLWLYDRLASFFFEPRICKSPSVFDKYSRGTRAHPGRDQFGGTASRAGSTNRDDGRLPRHHR
jgi:hypothetical protein